MIIALDAKRAYHNQRGLGNYSRDVIRLLQQFAPRYVLQLADPAGTLRPTGLWKLCPSLWRSWGITRQLHGTHIYHGLSGEVPLGIHQSVDKVVVTMHDAIFMRYPKLYSVGYRRLFARKVAYACRVADRIICISEQTKRDMIHFFGADERKIRVVYQGCNNRFREEVSEEALEKVRLHYGLPERYILTVGAIEPRKNLATMIRAMMNTHMDIPLVAVGADSRYAHECMELAEVLKVKLILLHHVPGEDLPALYKGADLFLYPSIFEGFGIPILEAMCIGVPVITSNGSCFPETGGDAAVYVDPYDVEAMADAIVRLENSPEERARMVERGKKQAEKFTDENVAKALIEVYEEVEV